MQQRARTSFWKDLGYAAAGDKRLLEGFGEELCRSKEARRMFSTDSGWSCDATVGGNLFFIGFGADL